MLAGLNVGPTPAWKARVDGMHANAVAYRKPIATPGDVRLEQVMLAVSEMLPDDAVVTNGAGNYAAFLPMNVERMCYFNNGN